MQVRAIQNPECGEIPPILRKHFSNGTYRNTTKKGTGKFTQDVYISDNVLKEQGKKNKDDSILKDVGIHYLSQSQAKTIRTEQEENKY